MGFGEINQSMINVCFLLSHINGVVQFNIKLFYITYIHKYSGHIWNAVNCQLNDKKYYLKTWKRSLNMYIFLTHSRTNVVIYHKEFVHNL